jgi:hypothetical protein
MRSLDFLKERLRITIQDLGLRPSAVDDSKLIAGRAGSLSELIAGFCPEKDLNDRLRDRIEEYCMTSRSFTHGEPLLPEHLNAILLWIAWCDHRVECGPARSLNR